MAIIYEFTVTHPSDVNIWPPQVEASAWRQSRNEYLKTLKFQYTTNTAYGSNVPEMFRAGATGIVKDVRMRIVFNNETELQAYVTDTTMPDELKSINNEWKTAHNISYEHKVYSLPEFDTTIDFSVIC